MTKTLRSNPGGDLAPDEVLGRDTLIRRIWEILDRQSVLLTAERRMGKSCLIKKMRSEPPQGVLAFYRDVEGVDSPLRFVERIYRDVEAHLGLLQRTTGRVQSFLRRFHGLEVPGVRFPLPAAPHWKDLLERTLEDLAEHREGNVVFFWDELPLMLEKIKRLGGEGLAMEVLDALRAARQTHPKLRMVYTGSIGLHHVVSSLREVGHAADATNDMMVIEVPPLDTPEAANLARNLLEGEAIRCTDRAKTSEAIAAGLDGIPYYVHHVVSSLRTDDEEATPESVARRVDRALTDPTDPWHLKHFRERLRDYYPGERGEVASAMLDELASAPPLAVEDLRRRLASTLTPAAGSFTERILSSEPAAMREVLTTLERDHYIHRDPEGLYGFRFPLVRRWWRFDRGLDS